jgi:hypothetical protein
MTAFKAVESSHTHQYLILPYMASVRLDYEAAEQRPETRSRQRTTGTACCIREQSDAVFPEGAIRSSRGRGTISKGEQNNEVFAEG